MMQRQDGFMLLLQVQSTNIRSVCAHKQVTYRFFHWKKGTPFAEDQGQYSMLTWWEQVDDGRQLTRNRKFLTVVPVVL